MTGENCLATIMYLGGEVVEIRMTRDFFSFSRV